jgi:hypothetical protein
MSFCDKGSRLDLQSRWKRSRLWHRVKCGLQVAAAAVAIAVGIWVGGATLTGLLPSTDTPETVPAPPSLTVNSNKTVVAAFTKSSDPVTPPSEETGSMATIAVSIRIVINVPGVGDIATGNTPLGLASAKE